MVEDLHIADPADVGYYSGMVDSIFSLSQLFTVRLLLYLNPLLPSALHRYLLFHLPLTSARRQVGHPVPAFNLTPTSKYRYTSGLPCQIALDANQSYS